MEMKVYDRLIILNILPKEGDITTLRIIRKLREDLSFSEEEHKALQFKTEGNKVEWKQEGDIPKDVNIGEKAFSIIKNSFEQLNTTGKLHEDHIPLYEKFVEGVS